MTTGRVRADFHRAYPDGYLGLWGGCLDLDRLQRRQIGPRQVMADVPAAVGGLGTVMGIQNLPNKV